MLNATMLLLLVMIVFLLGNRSVPYVGRLLSPANQSMSGGCLTQEGICLGMTLDQVDGLPGGPRKLGAIEASSCSGAIDFPINRKNLGPLSSVLEGCERDDMTVVLVQNYARVTLKFHRGVVTDLRKSRRAVFD